MKRRRDPLYRLRRRPLIATTTTSRRRLEWPVALLLLLWSVS